MGQYPKVFVILPLKPLVCRSALTNRLKTAEQVFFCCLTKSYQIQAKILAGKCCSWGK